MFGRLTRPKRPAMPRRIHTLAAARNLSETDYLKQLLHRHHTANAIAASLCISYSDVAQALARNGFRYERTKQGLGKWVHRPGAAPEPESAA